MLPHAKWASRQRLEAGNWERANGIEKMFVILEKSQESPFVSQILPSPLKMHYELLLIHKWLVLWHA